MRKPFFPLPHCRMLFYKQVGRKRLLLRCKFSAVVGGYCLKHWQILQRMQGEQ